MKNEKTRNVLIRVFDFPIVCFIFFLLLQGDSGGPLVCRNHADQLIQVGVASFTSRNNPERFPAVFARVSEFVDWIRFYVNV